MLPNKLKVHLAAVFGALILVVLGASSNIAEAQQAKKIPKIGFLVVGSYNADRDETFRQGLRELGDVEGQNIVIERRYAEGQDQRLRELAAEMVRLKVDIIMVAGDGAEAVKETTTTIPIIFLMAPDPIGTGLVTSLARPGGNVTGLSDLHSVLVTKRLEIIKEVVPSASRIAFFWNSASTSGPLQLKDFEAAATALHVKPLSFDVKGADDFERAFGRMGNARPGALVVHGNPLLATHRKRIFEFAIKSRLPAIFSNGDWVETGGLMSYGANFPDLHRRAATYVDKILKGTKPADLPVEQPTKFEFIINLKAAKQIGLTIPPEVLARADKVIKDAPR